MKLLKLVNNKLKEKQFKKEIPLYEDYYLNEYETKDMKFIWGVLSYDNVSGKKACMHTMNDLDLIYHKDEQKYSVSIETIYMFNGSHGEYSYMRNLLNKFTEFMEENGYSTQHELSLGKVFTNGLDINTHFHTIEECYAAFKMLVNGFCSLEKKND